MGRKKIRIAPIKDDRNRSVTFLKRKNGLFKKAYELGVLCSAEVAIVIFGTNGKLYEFANCDVPTTLHRHQNQDPHERKRPDDFIRKALAEKNKGKGEDDDSGDEDDEEEDDDVEDGSLDDPIGERTVDKTRPRSSSADPSSSKSIIQSRKSSTSNQTPRQGPSAKRLSPSEAGIRSRTPSRNQLTVPQSQQGENKKRRLSLEVGAKSPRARAGQQQQQQQQQQHQGQGPNTMMSYPPRPPQMMTYGNMFPQYEQPYMQMMGGQGFVPQGMPMSVNGTYHNSGVPPPMPMDHQYPMVMTGHNGGAVPMGYPMMGHPYPIHQQHANELQSNQQILPPPPPPPPPHQHHAQQYGGGEIYQNNGAMPSILHTQATPIGQRSSPPHQMPNPVPHHPGAVIMHSTQSPVNAMSSSLFAHIPPSNQRYQSHPPGDSGAAVAAAAAAVSQAMYPLVNTGQQEGQTNLEPDSPMTHFNKTWQRMTASMGQSIDSSSSPTTAGQMESGSFSASGGSVTSPFSPKLDIKMSPSSSSLGITGVSSKKPKLSLHIPEAKGKEEQEITERVGRSRAQGQTVDALPAGLLHSQEVDGQQHHTRGRASTPPFAVRNRHGGHQLESPTSSMRSSLEAERTRTGSRNVAVTGMTDGAHQGGGGGTGRYRTSSEPNVSSPLRATSTSLANPRENEGAGGATMTTGSRFTQSPLSPASGLPPSHHVKSSDMFASPSTVFPEFAVGYRGGGSGGGGGGEVGAVGGHSGPNQSTADSAVGHGPLPPASFFMTGRNGDAFLPSDSMLPSPLNFGKTPATTISAGTGRGTGEGDVGAGAMPTTSIAPPPTRASVYHWPSKSESPMPPPLRKLTGQSVEPVEGTAPVEHRTSPRRSVGVGAVKKGGTTAEGRGK